MALSLSRLLMSLVFIYAGYGKVMNLEGWKAAVAKMQFAGQALPQPELLAQISAYAEIVGGIMLAIGIISRVTAFGLMVWAIIAAIIGHAFWAMPTTTPVEIAAMKVNLTTFLKDLGLAGGLLLIVAYGGGGAGIDAMFRRQPM